jgi:hypothetical protein
VGEDLMPSVAKAMCVECYTAWYEEMQTNGSSSIQHYFQNEEIDTHLQANYDPSTGGHSMGVSIMWQPDE